MDKERRKMRVLLLLSESWNDISFPNNNMTNWFLDFPEVELATVSGSSLMPNNRCCKNYFLVGERDMTKSVITRKKVGVAYHFDDFPTSVAPAATAPKKVKFGAEAVRLMRDLVWRFGRYDTEALRKFIEEFKPDIVFSQRKGSIKMCRMERIISKMTDAPMVAYTGDDEYSMHQFSLSPLFWIRRIWLRATLKKNISYYKLFYSQSQAQMKEFTKDFKTPTKFLVKCGEFSKDRVHTSVNDTVRLVYAGKFYCNRWKTLTMLADAIREINKKLGKTKFTLDIYTQDKVTKKQNSRLNDGVNSIIHGKIAGSLLSGVYERSDIVLHVEGFDLKNRLLTRHSFSTKVMDSLASGCAVFAICHAEHAAGGYLREKSAALVANSQEEIRDVLEKIAADDNIILEYAKKAYLCGMENHQRKNIQRSLLEDFVRITEKC